MPCNHLSRQTLLASRQEKGFLMLTIFITPYGIPVPIYLYNNKLMLSTLSTSLSNIYNKTKYSNEFQYEVAVPILSR